MTHIVFVYGTLKRGHRNYRLLEDSTFLGEAITVDKFDMINSGFPVLLPNPDGLTVKGELFEIDDETLKDLDRLEGEGRMYNRKVVKAVWGEGEEIDCSIYIGAPDYWEDRSPEPRYAVGNHYEWSILRPKLYRIVASFDVEADNEEDAIHEAQDMMGGLTVESIREIEEKEEDENEEA